MEHEIDETETVCTAVIRAVSAIEGRPQTDLQPLTDVLDPDALNMLFAARSDGTPRTGGHLSFVYSNCKVTVDNGEYLTIELIDSQTYTHRSPDVTEIDVP